MDTMKVFCCYPCRFEYEGNTFSFRHITGRDILEKCFICKKVHMCGYYYVDDAGKFNDERTDIGNTEDIS